MQYLKKEVDRILNSAIEEITKEGFADASIRILPTRRKYRWATFTGTLPTRRPCIWRYQSFWSTGYLIHYEGM